LGGVARFSAGFKVNDAAESNLMVRLKKPVTGFKLNNTAGFNLKVGLGLKLPRNLTRSIGLDWKLLG
jgi:hypothetical protein